MLKFPRTPKIYNSIHTSCCWATSVPDCDVKSSFPSILRTELIISSYIAFVSVRLISTLMSATLNSYKMSNIQFCKSLKSKLILIIGILQMMQTVLIIRFRTCISKIFYLLHQNPYSVIVNINKILKVSNVHAVITSHLTLEFCVISKFIHNDLAFVKFSIKRG